MRCALLGGERRAGLGVVGAPPRGDMRCARRPQIAAKAPLLQVRGVCRRSTLGPMRCWAESRESSRERAYDAQPNFFH
jgi:hypothetical protein